MQKELQEVLGHKLYVEFGIGKLVMVKCAKCSYTRSYQQVPVEELMDAQRVHQYEVARKTFPDGITLNS
jgi:predicted nucleic-acid-binding Zn-ribbon protein